MELIPVDSPPCIFNACVGTGGYDESHEASMRSLFLRYIATSLMVEYYFGAGVVSNVRCRHIKASFPMITMIVVNFFRVCMDFTVCGI